MGLFNKKAEIKIELENNKNGYSAIKELCRLATMCEYEKNDLQEVLKTIKPKEEVIKLMKKDGVYKGNEMKAEISHIKSRLDLVGWCLATSKAIKSKQSRKELADYLKLIANDLELIENIKED